MARFHHPPRGRALATTAKTSPCYRATTRVCRATYVRRRLGLCGEALSEDVFITIGRIAALLCEIASFQRVAASNNAMTASSSI